MATTPSTFSLTPSGCDSEGGPVTLWIVLTVLSVLLTGFISYKLLRRYAHPNTEWYYLVAVWVSWVLGFVGIFLLPLDICVTLATGCKSPEGIFHAWEFVYWTTFIMAWVVDPLLQSFHNDGAFDSKTRFKNAVKENVRFYVIVVGIIVLVVVVLVGVFQIHINLAVVVIGIANTYGILLIILMLGYGIVAVPRDLWHYADPEGELEKMYFVASSTYEKAQDADYDLRILVSAVENAAERVNTDSVSSSSTEEGALIRAFMDTVVKHVPRGVKGNGQSIENIIDVDMINVAKLHTKLLAASAKFENRAGEWERVQDQIEHLKTVLSGVAPLKPGQATCWNRFYWSWRLHHATNTFKGAAIFCVVMSILTVWGELCVAFPPSGAWARMSVWGEILRATSGGFETYLFALISLSYMSICTFISLFQLNWFEAQLLTKKRTDASGLLFNAYYLCRLQFAIGFNYILTLKWRTEPVEGIPNRNEPLTGFVKIVETMQGPDYGIMWWFLHLLPLVIFIFAVITFFNVHAYLFKCMGVDIYSRPKPNDAEHAQRIVEGKELIGRETRRSRSDSGRVIEPVGGIRSQGYQAPRRSIVMEGGSRLAGAGSGGGGGGSKRKPKKKFTRRKDDQETGVGDSLLGNDTLICEDAFGKQEGFVGAGTRAIMGGGGGMNGEVASTSGNGGKSGAGDGLGDADFGSGNNDGSGDRGNANAKKKKKKKKKKKSNSHDRADFGGV